MKKPLQIEELIQEVHYNVAGGIAKIGVVKLVKLWVVYNGSIGGLSPIKRMDGGIMGGEFPSREAANAEVQRIVDYWYAPLTPKEIRHTFTARKVNREEEAELFKQFKLALLAKDWKAARRVYNRMSRWSREAIPDKVRLHLILN